MKFFSRTALMALATVTLHAAPAAAQTSITGNWLTEDSKAIVSIARCGNTICGRIARVLVRTPDADQRDVNNPDRSLRNRPIEGLRILSGFTLEDGQYRNGEIYDPESGRSYNARLRLNSNGTLRVTGCLSIGWPCQSQTWTRR